MNHSSVNSIDDTQSRSQAEDFFRAIFGQRAGSFLKIHAFQVHYSAGSRNKQSQQQPSFTEVPSLLNTSTGSLLGIKGAPCHVNAG